MEKKKNIKLKENITKYGEFVSSYFSWITLDNQKERAKELEEITKEKD